MNADRFDTLTSSYRQLRLGVLGDFCLDRYLEIDPARAEVSIETGLPVHNVVRVRSQPGAAGTILNNLVALGVGEIYPIGFCGDDGEGFELTNALRTLPGVNLDHFLSTKDRRTFTYCKPLILHADAPPQELNRLDSKNWTPTPKSLQTELAKRTVDLLSHLDGLVLMDQVDVDETGVVTRLVRDTVHGALGKIKSAELTDRERDGKTSRRRWPVVFADSRRGLGDFPPFGFKMNAAELGKLAGTEATDVDQVKQFAQELAIKSQEPIFVTLSEQGIVGAHPHKGTIHVPSLPLRGPIDIVGAGDAVMANLVAALAAGATLEEAMRLAMVAASCVIHQLGTTGTATPDALKRLLFRVKN